MCILHNKTNKKNKSSRFFYFFSFSQFDNTFTFREPNQILFEFLVREPNCTATRVFENQDSTVFETILWVIKILSVGHRFKTISLVTINKWSLIYIAILAISASLLCTLLTSTHILKCLNLNFFKYFYPICYFTVKLNNHLIPPSL